MVAVFERVARREASYEIKDFEVSVLFHQQDLWHLESWS